MSEISIKARLLYEQEQIAKLSQASYWLQEVKQRIDAEICLRLIRRATITEEKKC